MAMRSQILSMRIPLPKKTEKIFKDKSKYTRKSKHKKPLTKGDKYA
jgi:hypothetical protein